MFQRQQRLHVAKVLPGLDGNQQPLSLGIRLGPCHCLPRRIAERERLRLFKRKAAKDDLHHKSVLGRIKRSQQASLDPEPKSPPVLLPVAELEILLTMVGPADVLYECLPWLQHRAKHVYDFGLRRLVILFRECSNTDQFTRNVKRSVRFLGQKSQPS